MGFDKKVSDHFYELGLDLLYLGYTREDLEIWISKAEEEDAFEECDGLLRALKFEAIAKELGYDYDYGEEEEDFI